MPLLSCCSALMGHRSEIRVHSAWSEPPVLWIIIGAGAGTRKSAALRQVLSPLLTLADDTRQHGRHHHRGATQGAQPLEHHDDGFLNAGMCLPVVCTGEMSMQQLQCVLQEVGGGVLQVSERLEQCHTSLSMHALQGDNLKTSQPHVHDLYEALAGRLAFPPPGVHKGSGMETETSYSILSQPVTFNQCGFASPEYVVKMMVKSPQWLSGRFLVSCPPIEENSFTKFSFSHGDDSDSDNSSSSQPPRPKKAKRTRKVVLKDVYHNLARVHNQSSPRHYVFTKDAVSELQRFQEEEWCTIVNQLGGEDNGGVVGKSLGQIVRLTGVLKALSEASKPDLENGLSFNSEINTCEDTRVQITSEDVARAVELGKYFLEQKLSMTFMVSTGFFRASSTPRQTQNPTPPVVPQSSSFSYMPPPNPLNSLYGFPKVGTITPLSTVVGGGGVPSSPSPQPSSHLPQTVPTSSMSMPSPMNPPFPFNFPGGLQPHFPLMTSRNNPLSLSSPPHPPPSTTSPASSTVSEIDVATLPATWIPASPEEEMAEMSQAADFAQLEPPQFVAVHARRVKRLLECFDDGCGVSATTAAQKSIAPPVRVVGTNNRHPAWASALFFKKVADLGLGVAEQVRHPTNGRVYWRFKRKPTSELTEKNFQLLQYLRIDMLRYARLGQPTLNVPGLELEAVTGAPGSERGLDEEGSNSSGRGDGGGMGGHPNGSVGAAVVAGIKQELI